MNYLATKTFGFRNPNTGKFFQVIKGQIVTESFAKKLSVNGKINPLFVDGNLSHFERFVSYRQEMLKSEGFASCTYLAVCKGIIEYFGGDTKSLRKFARGGGTVKMAQRLERDFAETLGIEKSYYSAPRGQDDPMAYCGHTWDYAFSCSKEQEEEVIKMTLAHLNDLY
jgi:hypothetical protein